MHHLLPCTYIAHAAGIGMITVIIAEAEVLWHVTDLAALSKAKWAGLPLLRSAPCCRLLFGFLSMAVSLDKHVRN